MIVEGGVTVEGFLKVGLVTVEVFKGRFRY